MLDTNLLYVSSAVSNSMESLDLRDNKQKWNIIYHSSTDNGTITNALQLGNDRNTSVERFQQWLMFTN